jgi:hypothetical protein
MTPYTFLFTYGVGHVAYGARVPQTFVQTDLSASVFYSRRLDPGRGIGPRDWLDPIQSVGLSRPAGQHHPCGRAERAIRHRYTPDPQTRRPSLPVRNFRV